MNVIVIGGGVMGLSCAVRLVAAGAHVTLFDARACGEGASHASLGVLRPASPFAHRPLQLFHHASLNQFEPFVTQLQQDSGIPIRFRRLGHLDLLHSNHTLARAQARTAEANRIWPPVPNGDPPQKILTPVQFQLQFPALSPTSHGAHLCRTTAHVNPADLIAALKALCQKRGVIIHEHTPIRSVSNRTVHADIGDFSADAVLLTAGPWTPLISPLGAIPLTPAKGQAIAVPPQPLPHIVKSRSIYLVPTADELIIGSTTEPEAGFDESPTFAAAESLRAGTAKFFPALANAPILRHWSGLRADAPDHLPLMGPHPVQPHLYLCCGHYKTGISAAPLASELLTESILTQKIPIALAPFLPRA